MPVITRKGKRCEITECCGNGMGIFDVGETEVSNIGAFCIGIDTELTPSRIRIAFNPEESENQAQEGEIGLYTTMSVRVDGFPVPAAVFPELTYMKNCQEIYNLSHTWPIMCQPVYLKNNAISSDIPPFYAFNFLAKIPEMKKDDFYMFQNPLGTFTQWPYHREDYSRIATSVIPLGMEFVGPFEDELVSLLNEEGRVPFGELSISEAPIQNNQEFMNCVLTNPELASVQFDSVQSYDHMLLFKYLDMEGIPSFICAKLTEDEVQLYELENIEVEELQKNRVREIFEQFKNYGGYRPINWRKSPGRGGSAGKDHLLYEMDGAVFTLSGQTYAVAIDDEDNHAVWETLTWQVSMEWVAEIMSFTKSRIRWDSPYMRPRTVKNPDSAPPCWDKYIQDLKSVDKDEQERNPNQWIWFEAF